MTGSPFVPWLITTAGAGNPVYGLAVTQPQDGQYDAWNGFDGQGPMVFTLHQDVSIPKFLASPAILRWKDRVQWNFVLTSTATQARTYTVQVRDTAGAVLATLFTFSTGTAYVIGDTSWQTHVADLSPYAGSTVRLWFQESIPEPFTGPGQFEIDAISLQALDFVSIDTCNTGIPDRTVDPVSGATLQQFVTALVDACTGSARNHGDFVSCVTRGLNAAKGGILTGHEKGAINSCAAQTGRRGKY